MRLQLSTLDQCLPADAVLEALVAYRMHMMPTGPERVPRVHYTRERGLFIICLNHGTIWDERRPG